MFNQLTDLPETLTYGRESQYLTYIFNRWSHRRDRVAAEVYIAAYSTPGGLRAGFEYYRAIPETIRQNQLRAQTPLTMPVLTIGAEHATAMRRWPPYEATRMICAARRWPTADILLPKSAMRFLSR